VSAGLRPLWLLKMFHHDDLRLADIVVPLSSSSRDIVSAGLRPLCLKSHVPERVLASNPTMNNVCIGSDRLVLIVSVVSNSSISSSSISSSSNSNNSNNSNNSSISSSSNSSSSSSSSISRSSTHTPSSRE
jgi:hypothetical protein